MALLPRRRLHHQAHGRSHVYEPLTSFQIRVLQLEPGEWTDELRGSLTTVPLEGRGAVYYEAVSYCWGAPTRQEILQLLSSYLNITKTCSDALRRLRLNDRPRLLWIDQVCINQENTNERDEQVMVMMDVYRNAGRVIIYLGEYKDTGPWISKEFRNTTTDASYFDSQPRSMESKVIDIIRRPWFSRLWVLQEVASARMAVVVCGSSSVTWHRFVNWADKLYAGLPRPAALLFRPGHRPMVSMFQQLLQTRMNLTTDPRDKIFALLGIISQDEAAVFKKIVDYSSAPGEVYARATTSMLQTERSLQFLSAVQGPSALVPQSWVPDWSMHTGRGSFCDQTFSTVYDAGGRPAAARIPSPEILCAKGVRVDVLAELASTYPLAEDAKEVTRIFQTWVDFYRKRCAISDEKDGLVRLLQEVISGQPPSTEDPDFREAFEVVNRTGAMPLRKGENFARARHVFAGRRLFATRNNFIGLAPEEAQVGDVVCVLLGGPTPYILRPQEDDFSFVGECYVRGIMNGEALAHLRNELAAMGHVSEPQATGPCSETLREFAIR